MRSQRRGFQGKVCVSKIAGLALLVLFSALPAHATGFGSLDFQGVVSAQTSGNTVNITIDRIVNSSSTYTSGSLRIELWASTVFYPAGSSGYRTASIRTVQVNGLSDQLGPNR